MSQQQYDEFLTYSRSRSLKESELESETQLFRANSFGSTYLPKLKKKLKPAN
jgi:hypothetical protein